jgi:hypothetical protein
VLRRIKHEVGKAASAAREGTSEKVVPG